MTLLTFMGYFLLSMLVYQLIMFGALFVYKKYVIRKFSKSTGSGKIKLITLDELVNKTKEKEDKDKKTWH